MYNYEELLFNYPNLDVLLRTMQASDLLTVKIWAKFCKSNVPCPIPTLFDLQIAVFIALLTQDLCEEEGRIILMWFSDGHNYAAVASCRFLFTAFFPLYVFCLAL